MKNVESIYIQSEQKIPESCFVCLLVVVLLKDSGFAYEIVLH